MATRPTAPRATGWILGTIVVALLLGIGSWFLAISPVMTSTGEAQDQASTTRDANTLLRTKIAHLKEQFTHLDEYKAELAGLQTQIPTAAQVSAYLREVQALATARGVLITGTTSELGQTVVPAEPVVAAPATDASKPDVAAGVSSTPSPSPSPSPSATAGAGATTGSTGTAAASAVPDGFVAIPMSFTVLGTYENVVAFVGDLQNSTARLLLVTGFTGTAQDDADASGGRPATHVGDLELVVTGYTYVLADPLAKPTIPAVTVAPAPLPAPVPGKNPLIPVGG
ncbi:MAG TPA: hypothetical protein VGK17_15170 [Propionicimonas sp.]|jgi:Tfp pilus assembly protein PilO